MSFIDAGMPDADVGVMLTGGLIWSLRLGLLLGVTWLLTNALRRSAAAVRHRLWVAAMVAALALPMVRSASPWRWDVIAVEPAATSFTIGAASGVAGLSGVDALPSASDAGARGAATIDARAWLAIWAAGTAVALGMLALGLLRVGAVGRRARPPEAPEFEERVRRLARSVGLDRAVPVLESSEIALPLTYGLLRSRILLPTGAVQEWPANRLDAVLLHELGHVRRRDVLAHVLGRVLCALHWFNPLVWAAATRMARECERACDDLVLIAGTRPSAYAAHLLAFVKAGGAPTPAAALGMARRSEIEGRIVALLDPTTVRGPVRRRVGATAVGVVLGLGLLISLPGATAGDGAEGRAPRPQTAGVPAMQDLIAETLLNLLADPDATVREAAARSAGERRLSAAVPALSAALDDAVADVREEAAEALGQIRDPAAVPVLSGVVDRPDEREDVREAAIAALGEIGTAAAVTELGRALGETSSEELRDELVEALGETGHPEAVAVLGGLLDRADARLQRRVIDALAEIESDTALGVVIDQMRSDDPNLRRMAAQALGGTR